MLGIMGSWPRASVGLRCDWAAVEMGGFIVVVSMWFFFVAGAMLTGSWMRSLGWRRLRCPRWQKAAGVKQVAEEVFLS